MRRDRPDRSALRQIASARPLRRPRRSPRRRPWPLASRLVDAAQRRGVILPSGQSAGVKRSSKRSRRRRSQWRIDGRTRIQPEGQGLERTGSIRKGSQRRMRDCDRPRMRMSASAAAAWPSRVVSDLTP